MDINNLWLVTIGGGIISGVFVGWILKRFPTLPTPRTPNVLTTFGPYVLTGIIASIITSLVMVWAPNIMRQAQLDSRVPPPTTTTSLHIAALNAEWTDTGIDLDTGVLVEIIVPNPDEGWDCGNGRTSAQGVFDTDRLGQHLASSGDQCELVAKVGTGDPIRIGAYEKFPAPNSGRLFLAANDDPTSFHDNAGSITVTITVAVPQ
jgi:hypothetical protein